MNPGDQVEIASRVVDLALSEDPGYRLKAGFADRATRRVFGAEVGFAWFENVAVPALFAASLLLTLPLVVEQVRPALVSALPAAASALEPWAAVRWDILLAAAGVLLLVGLTEKLAAPRLRHLFPG